VRRLFVRGVDVGEGFVGALAASVAGLRVRKVELKGGKLVELLSV
jgi:hypothetical protein